MYADTQLPRFTVYCPAEHTALTFPARPPPQDPLHTWPSSAPLVQLNHVSVVEGLPGQSAHVYYSTYVAAWVAGNHLLFYTNQYAHPNSSTECSPTCIHRQLLRLSCAGFCSCSRYRSLRGVTEERI
jgi:hypothetical protein